RVRLRIRRSSRGDPDDPDHDDDCDDHHLDHHRDGPERRVGDRSSLMAKKNIDPLKAKEKKQKIILAVLGVAFLGLMAFQVPRVMKRMHPAPPPSASGNTSTTAAPAGTPSLAAPTLRGAEQSPTTPTPDLSLAASSAPAPPLQDGQLASFSRFASK